MDEQEWLVSDDPAAMLAFLTTPFGERSISHPQMSDRKLRLFAVACCRNARGPNDPNPEEVDAYEREGHWPGIQTDAQWAQKWANGSGVFGAALLREIIGNPYQPAMLGNDDDGYFYGPKVRRGSVLAWDALFPITSTVQQLAKAIYDERAFDRMPILGDALEDAGATSQDILEHCRLPSVHVRGCWLLDLIIGKS